MRGIRKPQSAPPVTARLPAWELGATSLSKFLHPACSAYSPCSLASPCPGGKVNGVLEPPCHSPTAMNCSESQRLQTLLNRLLLELHHRGNASGLGVGPGPSMGMGVVPDPFVGHEATSAKGNDAYLYILLIMIFYACLAGGLILAYTRSRKLVEAKDEPPLACVAEQEWVPAAIASADPENGQGLLAEGGHQLAPGALPTLAQGAERV